MKRTIKLTVLTLALTFISVAAFAQSATTTNAANNISATVVANCRITNFALAFGNYDPTSTTATDASTTFDVRCTRGTAASIALDLGVNEGGTGGRRLTDGAAFLTYGLFVDAGRTTAWTTAAPKGYLAASNAAVSQTIFGRIPAEQDVLVGNYFDTVQATINF
ncbi:MAG TPA: spore coat U domain-containing protein [Thermoanaerobaculia bacterium]|nr:spore coat U domain-containing protein [Thermoanaerobaculia bacterium]